MPGRGWRYNNYWKRPSTDQSGRRRNRPNHRGESRGNYTRNERTTYIYTTYIPDDMIKYIDKNYIEEKYDVRVTVDTEGMLKVSGRNPQMTCEAIDLIRLNISNISSSGRDKKGP